MAIRTITATTVKLISVKDLRPIDFQSGKRLAIPVEECNVCDRCGKLHVKVYEIQADDSTYLVGSGCCKRMFGWEPAKADVQDKERKAEEKAMQEALQKAAQSFIAQIEALEVPRPQCKGTQRVHGGFVAIWHADGVIIASEINHPGIGPEKRAEFAKEWQAMKLAEALKEYEQTYKTNRRAKQLVQTVKVMAKRAA